MPLTFVFLILVAATTGIRLWLLHRQTRAVQARRHEVPTPFSAAVSLADHQRAADYALANARISRIDIVTSALVLLGLTLGGGIQAIDVLWRTAGFGALWHGVAVVGSTLLITALLDLPLTWWRTFHVEARFGFNRTTPTLFIIDLLRGLALAVIIGGPLLLGILLLMQETGQWWWIAAYGLWIATLLIITWAWPVFIAPLFNRFSPLADETLRKRVEALLERCGFASRGVFVMDGSRRSTHGNAYFTGFGRNKRIVFFDTLIERLQPAEIEAVLAHELGHFRLHHVRQRLVVSLLTAFAGFAVLGKLAASPDFYAALGVAEPSNPAALLLFMLVAPLATFFLTPLGAWWSRQHEFAADAFAALHTASTSLADALVKLYRDNATTLTPDPLYAAFYFSHPPALTRIEKLQQASGEAR